MASLIFVNRMAELQLNSITAITAPTEESPLNAEENRILESAQGRILLFHLGGPMSFGAAKGMARRLANFDQYTVLILDLSSVPVLDYSASRAISDMIHHAQGAGRHALLVGAQTKVEEFLKRQGIFKILPLNHNIRGRMDALKFAETLLEPPQDSTQAEQV